MCVNMWINGHLSFKTRRGRNRKKKQQRITSRMNFLQRQERRCRDIGSKVTPSGKSGRRLERQSVETVLNSPCDYLVGASQWERLTKQLKCAIRERVKSQG